MTALRSLASDILGTYNRVIEGIGKRYVFCFGGRFTRAHLLEVDPSTVDLETFSSM
jgi:hypothetical protein